MTALGSLESTQEARGALGSLTLLSCSPNFPRASITRYTHAKHEPILKFNKFAITLLNSEEIVGHLPREY